MRVCIWVLLFLIYKSACFAGKDSGSICENDCAGFKKSYSAWILSSLGRLFTATKVKFKWITSNVQLCIFFLIIFTMLVMIPILIFLFFLVIAVNLAESSARQTLALYWWGMILWPSLSVFMIFKINCYYYVVINNS